MLILSAIRYNMRVPWGPGWLGFDLFNGLCCKSHCTHGMVWFGLYSGSYSYSGSWSFSSLLSLCFGAKQWTMVCNGKEMSCPLLGGPQLFRNLLQAPRRHHKRTSDFAQIFQNSLTMYCRLWNAKQSQTESASFSYIYMWYSRYIVRIGGKI